VKDVIAYGTDEKSVGCLNRKNKIEKREIMKTVDRPRHE
jgi:hypothetical protein